MPLLARRNTTKHLQSKFNDSQLKNHNTLFFSHFKVLQPNKNIPIGFDKILIHHVNWSLSDNQGHKFSLTVDFYWAKTIHNCDYNFSISHLLFL